jgi:hypothetical protein
MLNAAIMLITSWFCYIGFLVIVHYRVEFNSVATMAVIFFSGKFYLNFVLVIVTCAMIDFTSYAFSTLFTNNLAGALMVLIKEKGNINDRYDLPQLIVKALKKYDIYRQDDEDRVDEHSRVSSYRDPLALANNSSPSIGAEPYQNIRLHKINPYIGGQDFITDFNVDVIKIVTAKDKN